MQTYVMVLTNHTYVRFNVKSVETSVITDQVTQNPCRKGMYARDTRKTGRDMRKTQGVEGIASRV